MIKKVLLLIFALLISCLYSFANVITTQNEFIKISVNEGPLELGRFSIDTTGGDPTREMSKNQQLIYGGALPWTSYTTINIDDVSYIFGGETKRRAGKDGKYGHYVSGPTLKEGVIVTAYNYNDIIIVQNLSITRGTSSRMMDTALISYDILNIGSTDHEVGLRITLDTKLGQNDGAPIRVESHSLTAPRKFESDNIPMSWQAFDNLANPIVISQGNLYGQGSDVTKPNHLIFADWGTMADHVWNLNINEKHGFWRVEDGEIDDESREIDTAAAIIWDQITIKANETKTYSTAYGIGYINISPGHLSLGITSPSDIKFMLERTEPISVTGYLVNTGNFTAENVILQLVLPKGLKVIGDTPTTISSFRIHENGEMQGFWRIIPTGEARGNMNIKLIATSDNIERNETNWTINVDVPDPSMVVSPPTNKDLPLKTNERETIIPISIILTPAFDFQSATFDLHYNPAVIHPLPITRGASMVDNGRLLPAWNAIIDRANGVIKITLDRGSDISTLTQAEAMLASINFYIVSAGESQLIITNASYTNSQGEKFDVPVKDGYISTTK